MQVPPVGQVTVLKPAGGLARVVGGTICGAVNCPISTGDAQEPLVIVVATAMRAPDASVVTPTAVQDAASEHDSSCHVIDIVTSGGVVNPGICTTDTTGAGVVAPAKGTPMRRVIAARSVVASGRITPTLAVASTVASASALNEARWRLRAAG